MIARTWRGRTAAADADSYARYVRETGLDGYRSTRGNQGAYLLYRVEADLAEFLTVSFWDTLEDVRAFAGDDITRAVFYAEDDHYLVERDERAQHWHVEEAAS